MLIIMAQTSIITGQYVCIHQTAATVVQRVIAWLIDMVFLYVAGLIAAIGVMPIVFSLEQETIAIVFTTLLTLSILSYPLLMEVFNHGQSIGKYLVGIKVASLDGSTPTLGAYLLRWLLLLIDWGFMGVGLAAIVFTKNSQRIGDLAAGTTVVKLPKQTRSINTYDLYFANNHYTPTYPEAAHLSLRQFNVIARTLLTQNEARAVNIIRLAEKTEQVLGVSNTTGNAELFLRTIYNDFQYYASRVV